MEVCFSLNNSLYINFFNTLQELLEGLKEFKKENNSIGKISIDLINKEGKFLSLNGLVVK